MFTNLKNVTWKEEAEVSFGGRMQVWKAVPSALGSAVLWWGKAVRTEYNPDILFPRIP